MSLKEQIEHLSAWLETARNHDRNNLKANWETVVKDLTNLVVRNASQLRMHTVDSSWQLYECVRMTDWHHFPWAGLYRKELHKALLPLREEMAEFMEMSAQPRPGKRDVERMYVALFVPAIDQLKMQDTNIPNNRDGVANGLQEYVRQAQLDNMDLAMRATTLLNANVDRPYSDIRMDPLETLDIAYEALAGVRYRLRQQLHNLHTLINEVQNHEDFYNEEINKKRKTAQQAAELDVQKAEQKLADTLASAAADDDEDEEDVTRSDEDVTM